MSEVKFTPGPWHTEFHGDSDFMAWQVFGSERDTWVAECGCGGNSEACARFIAAAPEMYDALNRIITELPTRRDWLDPVTEQMAKAALAKARGGAQ